MCVRERERESERESEREKEREREREREREKGRGKERTRTRTQGYYLAATGAFRETFQIHESYNNRFLATEVSTQMLESLHIVLKVDTLRSNFR